MSRSTTSLQLDAREPYLADHRPGGTPLLPTALCLETLASACARLRPGVVLEASDVHVGDPCLVRSGESHDVQVLVEEPASKDGALRATLHSGGAAGPQRTHMRARFIPRRAIHADQADDACGAGTDTPLAGTLVYRQFFHGPAWQVVASVGWRGEHLVARLAQALPPLRQSGAYAGVLAPRLLELALQSAGLLEIAHSGRSMIPHAIDRVQRLLPLDETSGVPLLAIARHGAAPGAIDVAVCTEDGRCALRVRGYLTVPLPFASDPHSLAALAGALRACRAAHATAFPAFPATRVH